MNIGIALSSVPRHLLPGRRFDAATRQYVADLPEYLFVQGAAMRAAGAEWSTVANWVRQQGFTLAESTVRNTWAAYMKSSQPQSE